MVNERLGEDSSIRRAVDDLVDFEAETMAWRMFQRVVYKPRQVVYQKLEILSDIQDKISRLTEMIRVYPISENQSEYFGKIVECAEEMFLEYREKFAECDQEVVCDKEYDEMTSEEFERALGLLRD